jgi:putative endonuclease
MSNPENNRKRLGSVGETLVSLHLERLGWQVLATNYRCIAGEMDVIAVEPTPGEPTLVFVEVKTRHGRTHGAPAEAVTPRKRAKLIAVAQMYLASRESGDPEPRCRFDIAEVLFLPEGTAKVMLRQGAFGAE